MRAVLQRVSSARVEVAGEIVGSIGPGLLILLGVGRSDTPEDAAYLAEKVTHLRVFPDESGKMNLNLLDVQGELLVISQFTLYGDCRKGRRPNFSEAAAPENARQLYQDFLTFVRKSGVNVETGEFQAHMRVTPTNDGPVTLILDTRNLDRLA